ncbi:MAG: DUF6689 family protein [Rhodanobacteraceae bacterium]
MVGAAGLALATAAPAQVVVTVDGNTAHADISLTSGTGETYEAEATIVFDTPTNLSPESLNITAEIIDPAAIAPRLPPADNALLCPGGDVSIDPAFPVMITVEPPDIAWLFETGFDGGSASGGLEFLNVYSFEIHTHDLFYEPHSRYRLFKAPIGDKFVDITNAVEAGSVRARGRHGAFSQFVIAKDLRGLHGLLGVNGLLCSVYSEKTDALVGYVLGALLGDVLRLDLLRILAKIVALIPIDVLGALGAVEELIATIDENAGTEIPNIWRASHDVTNSAGEMKGLAEALRFDLEESLETPANP